MQRRYKRTHITGQDKDGKVMKKSHEISNIALSPLLLNKMRSQSKTPHKIDRVMTVKPRVNRTKIEYTTF
jgi:hypothetical protein